MSIKAGRSRFTLSTLPAAEFPVVEEINAQQTIVVPQAELDRLIDKTHFSMAQQDVRYYLNGLCSKLTGGSCEPSRLTAIVSPSARRALAGGKASPAQQVIVPRKGVLELQRILGQEMVTSRAGSERTTFGSRSATFASLRS